MSYFDLIALFAVTFLMVFLLGIQSRNVQRSHYLAAIITSFGISVGNFVFVKFAATGDLLTFAVSAAGGCSGIAACIWFADNVLHKYLPNAHKRAQTHSNDVGKGKTPPMTSEGLSVNPREPFPKIKCFSCLSAGRCHSGCDDKENHDTH